MEPSPSRVICTIGILNIEFVTTQFKMNDIAKKIYTHWLDQIQETPEESRSMICNMHPAVNYRLFGSFLRNVGVEFVAKKNERYLLPGGRVVQVASRCDDGFDIRGCDSVALLLLQGDLSYVQKKQSVFSNVIPLARNADTRVVYMAGDIVSVFN